MLQEMGMLPTKNFQRATFDGFEAIRGGLDPTEIIRKGPAAVLKEIGDKFACGELFLPELVAAGQAGEASINVLNQEITKRWKSVV